MTKADHPPAIYMSKNQVAQLIGVYPHTLMKWCKSGQFPAPIAFGAKTFRWDKAQVESHIERLSIKL